MKTHHKLGLGAAVLIALGALAYANRIHVLQYSLGWYTDIRHPRGAYQETPWMPGPQEPAAPVAQRPPNIIVIMADDLGINDVSMHGGGRTAEGVPTPADFVPEGCGGLTLVDTQKIMFENGRRILPRRQ